MLNVAEELRKQVKESTNCPPEKRMKWLCYPGPHHPDYFQNTTVTKDAGRLFENKPGGHWRKRLPTRSPMDPYRRWMEDSRGFRKDTWYNAPNDCDENIKKNFYTPYYTTNEHNLIKNSEALTEFWNNHPGRLLNDYVYRRPDDYLKSYEERKEQCTLGKVPPYTAPSTSKLQEYEIMRSQFMSNNYLRFDDGFAVDFDH